MPKIYKQNCEKCGAHYKGGGKRFCSPACAGAVRRPATICGTCGNGFAALSIDTKYCSRACWYKHQKHHAIYGTNFIAKACETCHKSFQVRPYEKTKGRFCGVSCYQVWAKTLKKEKRPSSGWGSVTKQDTRQNRYYNFRRRCARLNLGFAGRDEFYVWYDAQPKQCHYCEIPQNVLERLADNRTASFIHLDRKDNSLGYTLDNIVLACGVCNLVKSAYLSYEEMLDIGQRYMKPKWQLKAMLASANSEVCNGWK